MKKYTNVPCVYCHEVFDEKDEVVVCPICGAPHHRECYAKLGHCADEEAHASGKEWVSPVAPAVEERTNNQPNPTPPYTAYGSPTYSNVSGFEIGGVTAAEMTAYIGPKAPVYFVKFTRLLQSPSQMSWNWSAFFFSYLYFFYRKMYTFGIALLLFSALAAIPNLIYAVQYVKSVVPEAYVNAVPYSQELLDAANKMLRISQAMGFGLSLACGLFANKMYLKQVLESVHKSREYFVSQPGSRAYYDDLAFRGKTNKILVIIMILVLALYYLTMVSILSPAAAIIAAS